MCPLFGGSIVFLSLEVWFEKCTLAGQAPESFQAVLEAATCPTAVHATSVIILCLLFLEIVPHVHFLTIPQTPGVSVAGLAALDMLTGGSMEGYG